MKVRDLISWPSTDRCVDSTFLFLFIHWELTYFFGYSSELENFQGLSFTTISSTGPNGGWSLVIACTLVFLNESSSSSHYSLFS